MKKIIIMSLFATLVSVFTASAQENTYSIVVKMQNGTVLTIGPNEADSIYFTEGKLNVSGQSIEDIQKQIAQLQNDIKYNKYLAEEVQGLAMKNSNRLDQSENKIEALIKISTALDADVDDIKKDVVQIGDLKASIDSLMESVYSNDARISELEKDNTALAAKIAQLEAIVSELQNK